MGKILVSIVSVRLPRLNYAKSNPTPSAEFKLECEYLRVPLKRGKASQTYIESSREKKAAALNAPQNSAPAPQQPQLSANREPSTTAHSDPFLHATVPPVTESHEAFQGASARPLTKARTLPLTGNSDFSIDNHGLMFDQAITPNTGWLMNLVSSPLATPAPEKQAEQANLERNSQVFMNRESTYPHPHTVPVPPQVHHPHTIQAPTTALPNADVGGSDHQCRFPVLDSVVHELDTLPRPLAEHLLESFFSCSTHTLAHIIRRRTFLSPTHPRESSPALIFSCMMVAAHHSVHPQITGTPGSREIIIERLTELTIEKLTETAHQVKPKITLDDVISFIHLGTVVSASEFKGASLRYWAAAWALAKELKLQIELPDLPEEVREERRRTWWLLYIVDRHLGLCYNRPLAMMDSECGSLYRPMDDSIWLSDEIDLTPAEQDPTRIQGFCNYVTGQGLFGYFLPLMTILGSLLELHHLQQNPVMSFTDFTLPMKTAIMVQLDQFTSSLNNWTPMPCNEVYENAWRDYAFQISHVIYILVLIPWDPLELLNSPNSVLTSSPFTDATAHAITAAQHMRRILTIDSDLMLMPFFLGIYLLQNSFVLLAVIDRVEHEASREVVNACETVVHAHEVCVVTLDTEYQRNFRRVMRGTINLLQQHDTNSSAGGGGGSSVDSPSLSPPLGVNDMGTHAAAFEEQKRREKEKARQRRTEILGLYRWTSGGHGLAV